MKLTYQRTGGVAGIRKQAVVDTDRLPAAERAEWEALVAAADFFALPPALAATNPQQRDAFTHTVAVNDGARSHTVEAVGAPASPPVRALLDRLQGASARAPE